METRFSVDICDDQPVTRADLAQQVPRIVLRRFRPQDIDGSRKAHPDRLVRPDGKRLAQRQIAHGRGMEGLDDVDLGLGDQVFERT